MLTGFVRSRIPVTSSCLLSLVLQKSSLYPQGVTAHSDSSAHPLTSVEKSPPLTLEGASFCTVRGMKSELWTTVGRAQQLTEQQDQGNDQSEE